MGKHVAIVIYGIPGLAFALWSAPFLVMEHALPITTFYPELLAFIIATCLFLLAFVLQARIPGRMPAPAILLAPIGLLITLFLQLAVHRDARPVLTFVALFFCICAIAALQAGTWIGQDRQRTSRVLLWCALGSLLGGLLSAAMAWMQAFGVESHYARWVAKYPEIPDRRIFANLFQANHLATVLCLAMASAMYLRQLRAIGWVTLIVADLILAIGVAFAASRTPIFQVAVIAAVPALLAFGSKSRDAIESCWREPLRSGLILLTIFVLAQTLVAWLNREFDLGLSISAAARMSEFAGTSPRAQLWRYALDMFLQHPILGVGWGEFVHAQYLAADRLGEVAMANNAHDIVLDLLAKTGILGASAVLLPCTFWVARVIKAIRGGQDAANRTFCFVVVAVFFVHALLEFPHHYAFFLLPVCLMVGLGETRVWMGMTRSLSLTLGTLVAVAVFGALWVGYRDYKKVEVAFQENGVVRYLADPALIFGDWGRLGTLGTMPLDKDLLSEKIEMHEHAIALVASPNYIRRLIVLLVLDGRSDEALYEVKRLKNLSQNFDFQYKWLVAMCDEQIPELRTFRDQLFGVYGRPQE